MQEEIRSITALVMGDEPILEHSGSIVLGDATDLDLTVVTQTVPSSFDLEIHAQQSLDNLSFFDIGQELKVLQIGTLTQRVSHVLARFARVRISFSAATSGDAAVLSLTLSVVPKARETGAPARPAGGLLTPTLGSPLVDSSARPLLLRNVSSRRAKTPIRSAPIPE